jgi:hypothetical protein
LSRSRFSWHYKAQSLPHVRQVRLVSLVKDQVRKIGGVDATLGAIADRLRIEAGALPTRVSRWSGVAVAGQVSSAPLAPWQEALQVSSAECGRPAEHSRLSQEVGKRSFSADVSGGTP